MSTDREKENGYDPYAELKGYFPEEYDLSPDELEKTIREEENKQRIALGMTQSPPTYTAKFAAVTPAAQKPQNGEEEIKAVEPQVAQIKADAAPKTEFVEGTEPEASKTESDEAEGVETFTDIDETPDAAEAPADTAEESLDEVPYAEDVTDNELLNKYPSLDELLSELENSGESSEDGAESADGEAEETDGLRKKVNWFFDFLEVFSICMACIILTFTFAARLTRVDGHSMDDTLSDGQYLVVSNLFYTPTPGDIVVLQNTSLNQPVLKEPLVKRIIAVGGQTVDIALDGTVTITEKDGTSYELDQSFTKDEEYKAAPTHCEVPEGYVFVMGDNRNGSTDSRDYRVGIVDERCIFGRALVRIIPVGEFTVFHNPYSSDN